MKTYDKRKLKVDEQQSISFVHRSLFSIFTGTSAMEESTTRNQAYGKVCIISVYPYIELHSTHIVLTDIHTTTGNYRLNHKNIIRLFETIEDNQRIHLIMEVMTKVSPSPSIAIKQGL